MTAVILFLALTIGSLVGVYFFYPRENWEEGEPLNQFMTVFLIVIASISTISFFVFLYMYFGRQGQ